jgi:GNAT superfamily N-acetyltransferase
MTIQLRRAQAADAAVLGDICYRAFKAIAEAHGFEPDFPSPQAGAGAIGSMIGHPRVFNVVAELDGRMVGSNFLDERGPICAVGPITVDPEVQDDGAGRAMMAAVLQRCEDRGVAGVRLVQAGYHMRSLALYLKLGFEAREHLSCFQGPALARALPGYMVRVATTDDVAACNRLCHQVHGHDRGGELADAIARGLARVVERDGRITGYASAIAFSSHAVGETNGDLEALIAAAETFAGPGFLILTGNGALMRWCFDQGLRVTQTLTLMSRGLYNHADGAWLPSVLY